MLKLCCPFFLFSVSSEHSTRVNREWETGDGSFARQTEAIAAKHCRKEDSNRIVPLGQLVSLRSVRGCRHCTCDRANKEKNCHGREREGTEVTEASMERVAGEFQEYNWLRLQIISAFPSLHCSVCSWRCR